MNFRFGIGSCLFERVMKAKVKLRIRFRVVQKAVQIFFLSDISNRDIICAPRIGDEVMQNGSKSR